LHDFTAASHRISFAQLRSASAHSPFRRWEFLGSSDIRRTPFPVTLTAQSADGQTQIFDQRMNTLSTDIVEQSRLTHFTMPRRHATARLPHVWN
jgi:hypothetical protein